MTTSGCDNRPFVGKPVKAAYMWRDIERRAAWRNLPVRVPAPYPLENGELANRVAIIVADQQGWLKPYVTEAYRRWMVDGQMAGSEPNLSGSIIACGRDPESVVSKAKDADELRGRRGPLYRHAIDKPAPAGPGSEHGRTLRDMIDADKSDLYDVLGYNAFALSQLREKSGSPRARSTSSCSARTK